MAKNHISQQTLDDLHADSVQKCITGIDQGACLTGHDPAYQEVSCAYRWQAHMAAKEREGKPNSTHYNVRTVDDRFLSGVITNAYKAKSGNFHPSHYLAMISPPRQGKGDWDLEGPAEVIPRKTFLNQPRDILPGTNFTDCYNPYWHNSHHMIPKRLFNTMIDETGKGEGANPDCPMIIRSCLLEAKYNINHKVNMIILPQDKEVGEILKLPRHLILLEEGDGEDVDAELRKEMMSHVEYDRFVGEKLRGVILGFKKRVAEKTCESPDPKPTLSKKQIEKVSLACFNAILGFGSISGGQPLSDIK
jgi:hypothetical protein